MAKTMAEVLAEHYIDITETNPDNIGRCVCGFSADPMNISWDEHLEAALSAAGYGLVADAKREALDFQQIADVIMARVVYAGNEGWTLTAEDRDDHEYAHCLDAAQEIADGRPQQ